MQKFVCQPNLDGKFEIARWDEIEEQYVPIPNELYSYEKEAEDWARQLNEEEEIRQEKAKYNKKNDGNEKK
jgi:hypothetical protein